MRNVKTREGMEYWDKICSLKHYGFIHSPDNSRVLKTEGIGNWIDKFEAQAIVDQAQDEINQFRAERDALQLLLNQRDEQVETLKLQRQGEPVAWQIRSRTNRPDSVWTGWRECSELERAMHSHEVGKFNRFGIMREIRPLYATRAAPAPLDYGSLDPVQRLAVCRGDAATPVAVVPDGYCIMPRQLTAENGAKALLLGEFKLLVTEECPECCELEEPAEGCSICDGEGEYGQKHTIPWDKIKFIYSKAVEGLAVEDETNKPR